MTASAVLLTLMLTRSASLAAQEARAEPGPCERSVDMSREASQFPMIGLRFGAPLRFAAYNGWWWPTGRNTLCEQNLWVATTELGIGGAQVNFGRQHGSGRPGAYLPFRAQLSLLHTFLVPMVAPRDATFAGVELQAQGFLGVRGSVFWPIANAHERFVAVSVLLGF